MKMPLPGLGEGHLHIFTDFRRWQRVLVLQLVNVFENQLINGLTRAGSVNLKADLRA